MKKTDISLIGATTEKDIPDKVSWRVIDAWAAIPPCDPSSSHPYCHIQCPYFYGCFPEEYECNPVE